MWQRRSAPNNGRLHSLRGSAGWCVITATLTALLVAQPSLAGSGEEPGRDPHLTHVVLSEPPTWLAEVEREEDDAVADARNRFGDAGLEFPDVVIRFNEDERWCNDKTGRYRPAEGPDLIDVCYPRRDDLIRHVPRARLLWHELSHAYVERHTALATRQTVLELLDLEAWTGGPWSSRGMEVAAEILVWGIHDGSYRLNREIPDLACETKAAVYEQLTGRPSLPCAELQQA